MTDSTRAWSLAQAGAWPPPISPQLVQTPLMPGICSSSRVICPSSRVILAVRSSMSSSSMPVSTAWMSRNRPVRAASSWAGVALSR